jgi:hypothetical protein
MKKSNLAIASKKVEKEIDYHFTLSCPGLKGTAAYEERVFEVKSFYESEDSYDKGTEFLVLASPALMRILGLASATDSPLAQLDPGAAFQSMDTASLIRDLASALPELTALSCQMTDPSIDAEDVKRLVKSPVSAGMLKAVVLQMKKDELFKRFAEMQQELSGLVAELGSLAG